MIRLFKSNRLKLLTVLCLFATILLMFNSYTYRSTREFKIVKGDSSEGQIDFILNQIFSRESSPETQNKSGVETKSEKKCDIIRKEKPYSVNIGGHVYPQYLLLSQNNSYNFDCINKTGPMKLILGWNKFYGTPDLGYGAGKVKPFLQRHCPVTNCEVTSDRSRVNEADYVVVHFSDQYGSIPKARNAKTRWIWMLIEAPFYTRKFGELNGLFNYTSDYQLESEFGSNYISQMRMIWKENTTFRDDHDYSAGKTGQVTALISNCGASNKRMEYVTALKKHIGVDVYGKCGQPCPKNEDCREYVAKKYKFYFSFENCICKDYITEKFFLMLKYNIIPIVFGGGNYTRFIPKSAFIDAQDFESAAHLAEYLNYVNTNVTAYNDYFKWKRHVNFLEHTVEWGMICDMCIQLHLEEVLGVKQKVITDFDTYWNKNSQCKYASQVPQLKGL